MEGCLRRAMRGIFPSHHALPYTKFLAVSTSNDPAFAAEVEDIVRLYMNPPEHAVVVSIDEKSEIQALDRTQPGLPLKPGWCGTMTHDYKRHGTTTLFAALNRPRTRNYSEPQSSAARIAINGGPTHNHCN